MAHLWGGNTLAASEIFLSYNREDQDVARRFAEALAAEGFDVWWDQTLRSGEAYDEVTEAALRAARAVVVLWSPRSVVSRWVRAEATLAERNKTLAPVRIEACELPIMFELTQTADLTQWSGAKTDPAWQSFVRDVRRLLGSEAEQAPPPMASPSGGGSSQGESFIPAIAVLPVTTRLGGVDEDAAFADDLTDELIAVLSTLSSLRTIPAGISAAWRNDLADLRPLAQDLGARYLLENTLRRTGENFRVTVRLIGGASAKVLWSHKFVRPLCELDDVPDALAAEIAVMVSDRANYLEYELADAKKGDLTAWDHFCRAVRQMILTTNASLDLAIEECEAALALAPDWDMAHAGLAMNLALSGFFAGDLDRAKAAQAQKHINAALAIGIDNASALTLVGGASNFLGDPATGLRYLERSISLNPHQTGINFHLEVANIFLGRTEEGLAQAERHLAKATTDQLAGWIYQYKSLAHYIDGQDALAAAAMERMLHYIPNAETFLVWPAMLAALCGDEGLARTRLAKLRAHLPQYPLEAGLHQLDLFLMSSPNKAHHAKDILARLWAEADHGH